MSIDVEKLLAPVAPQNPCGEDLGYDKAFAELDLLVRGTPEHVIGSGAEEKRVPAQEPDWHEVGNRCVEMLGRTKHLRVALYLALAQLKLEGLPGLADGLAVMRGLLEKYWDGVYPRLDPEDRLDPTERINSFRELAAPLGEFQDSVRFQQRVREVPLADSRRLGRYSYRDIAIARGSIPPPASPEGQKPADLATIAAALDDTDTDRLLAASKAVEESLERIAGIGQVLAERAGEAHAVDFSGLRRLLGDIQGYLRMPLVKRGLAAPLAVETGPAGERTSPGPGAGPGGVGEIRSPADALAALERVCRYYEKQEPSSPVPLLLRRAQRLVSKSFLEIVKDLSPQMLGQIEGIAGIDNSKGQG